jgi:hypothetical protein
MEQSASQAGIHPAWHRDFRRVQWVDAPLAAKRIAILDPFEIECRLLGALAEAHGHDVVARRDPDDFLAGIAEAPPHIAFVHAGYEPVLRFPTAVRALPPIVLIDSFNIGRRCHAHVRADFGPFPALRFPIGLAEIAEAIRLHAR